MPISLGSGGEIKRLGFARRIGCSAIYESPEIAGEGKWISSPTPPAAADETSACTVSSSSSIGKNSESFGSDDGEDLAGEKEVESRYKGPLSALESLEEALPLRRGISNFYNGKSKSFASLSDAMVSCASSKGLGKQDNAYTRKRRNILATKNFRLKSSSGILRSSGGGISKKNSSTGQTILARAAAMRNSSGQEDQDHQQYRLLPPPHPLVKNPVSGTPVRSPLPQYRSLPLRSFSMIDLQGLGGSVSSVGLKDANKGFF